MSTQIDVTEDAIYRAMLKTTQSDASIKTFMTIGRECIWEYMSGDLVKQYQNPEVVNYMTHPDIAEIAEEIAEKVRGTLSNEDDGIEDRLMEIVHDRANAIKAGLDLDGAYQELEESLGYAYQAINHLLRPMILRILDTGDWREEEES